jgi:plasmid stabilization system protein ParE
MVKVIWAKAAFKDLRLIFDFVAVDSEQHQKMGRVVPEFKDELIRELFEYSYRIVYRIDNELQVTILRIHHQAQILPPL